MINIKIIYQYDGSCFYGSQRQKGEKTVQGTIENILLKLFMIFLRYQSKINTFMINKYNVKSQPDDFFR